MRLYLKRWRFSAQKPLTRATQRDPQKIAAWLRLDYPSIAARAKRHARMEAGRPRVAFFQKLLRLLHQKLRFQSGRIWPGHTSSRQNYLMQPNYKTARESGKIKQIEDAAEARRRPSRRCCVLHRDGKRRFFRGGAENRCYITYIREAADFWRPRRIPW